MIPVAAAKDVTVHAPEKTFVAFRSSPYPVHVQGGAVDIFGEGDFDSSAKCPVAGEVISILKRNVGYPRFFDSEPNDYEILLKTQDACVRFLHIEPEIEVEEHVKLGQIIGKFIRSPLLPFWSQPHVHVEIKDLRKISGPQNAFLLERIGEGKLEGELDLEFNIIETMVVLATENYIVVSPDADIFGRMGRYFGVTVGVGGDAGLLDAHAPWNCYGGVALPENSKVEVGDEVRLGKVLLGKVENVYKNIATYSLGGKVGDGVYRFSKGLMYRDVRRFNVPRKRIHVNGEEYLGFSTGLSLFENRTLRLIPEKPLERKYEMGEKIIIDLDPQ